MGLGQKCGVGGRDPEMFTIARHDFHVALFANLLGKLVHDGQAGIGRAIIPQI
ncbi:hypothetical protein AA14362_1272 [Acetobacter cerevisiae DSM 14362]|nr:hypothetical protein AA14362_1272 [Acetobacter cerevisiae DSM 14362]